jgi:hypothetical protein
MVQWRKSTTRVRLINIFHELYAQGKPWNSSYWLGPLQRKITYELWQLADFGVTTNCQYFAKLRSWRPDPVHDRLACVPVFSNVGEPSKVPSIESRTKKAAIFGSGLDGFIYRERAEIFEQFVRALNITTIVDIGARNRSIPSSIGGARVLEMGRLTASEISDELLQCRFGFGSYDVARLGKSTVFAAFAAHGVIPVCFEQCSQEYDGLRGGRDFLCLPVTKQDSGLLSDAQRVLLSWYGEHSLDRSVDCIAAAIFQDY